MTPVSVPTTTRTDDPLRRVHHLATTRGPVGEPAVAGCGYRGIRTPKSEARKKPRCPMCADLWERHLQLQREQRA